MYYSIVGVYLLTVPGAEAKTIGLMLLVGNIAGFVFELPSGYFSDWVGHRKALIIARVSLLLSSTAYLIGDHVAFFIAGMVLMNLSVALWSGTGEAFMHDTLRGLGKDKDYAGIMGRLSSIGFAVPIILIMAIPFFVSISFKVPFIIGVGIDIIGLIVSLTLIDPPRHLEKIEEVGFKNFGTILKKAWHIGFTKYALFTATMAGVIIAEGGFKDAYQAFLGIPIIYFGIFWGLSRLVVSLLLLLNGKIKNKISLNQFLGIELIISLLLVFGLGLITTPWMVVVIFILSAGFNWGFLQVKNHYFLEIIENQQYKATLLSLEGLFRTLMIGGVAFFLGKIIGSEAFARGFLVVAITSCILLCCVYGYIVIVSKRKPISNN